MKRGLIAATALLIVGACSDGRDAAAAIEAMKLSESGVGAVKYSTKTASGDKFTFKNVVFSLGTDASIAAETMVLDGLDLTGEGKPVVSDIILSGLSPEAAAPGVAISVKEIALRDLNPVMGAYLADVFANGPDATAPAFESWGLGSASLNGLEVKTDLAQVGAGAGSFNVSLGELSFADLEKSALGRFSLSGLKGDFDVPAEAGFGFPMKGSFDFGVGEIKNFRAGVFANALAAGFQSAMDPAAAVGLEAAMMKAMSSPIDPGYDELSWSEMNIDAAGLKLATSKIGQKVSRNGDGVAVSVSSPRASMTLTADAAQGQLGAIVGGALGAIGYQTLELYGETEATFDPKTDTTRFTKYGLGLKDGFDLVLTGGFKGVQSAMSSLISAAGADPLAAGAEPDLSGLGDLTLVDLDLKLTDKSFVNRMLNLSGFLGAPDAESLRTDIVNQVLALQTDLSSAGVDPGLATELLGAVAEFIRTPGTLSLKMTPKAPLRFGDVSGPEQLTKDALGLSASHAAP